MSKNQLRQMIQTVATLDMIADEKLLFRIRLLIRKLEIQAAKLKKKCWFII